MTQQAQSQRYKVLIVDDDTESVDPLRECLTTYGYDVVAAADGEQGLQRFESDNPDLVIVDILVPPPDGFEVVHKIRENSIVPIIMTSVRDHDVDHIMALDSGADEYVVKPLCPRVMVGRVKAHLRRAHELSLPDIVKAGHMVYDDLKIDLDRHRLIVDGNVVRLRPTEYRLLVYFARHPNTVLTREKLYEEVWGNPEMAKSRVLDVHIRNLRAKIERNPVHPSHIITIRGFGYKFV